MKKLKSLFASLLFLGVTISYVMADLTTTTLTSKETSCEGGIRDYVYYLGTSHPMKDTFFEGDGASASEYIYVFNFDLSEAAIWNSGVFSNNYSWQRKSQGLPKGVKKVVAVSSDNGVTIINKPANYTSRNTVAAQVIFKINSRKYEWKKAGNENTIQYIDFDHQADGWKNYNYGPPKLISDKQVKNECLNIHIGFCGDGIVDNGNQTSSTTISTNLAGSEQCDPNDPKKTNRGNGGCSNTCQPITLTQPACNSTYNGQTFDTLTSSAPLCNPGTVSNFTSTATGRTWTCTGQQGTTPAQCSATKKSSGTPVIEKTLLSPDIVTTTGETVKRKITVTASGGAISNFSIIEKVPDELAFSGRTTISSPITLQEPTKTNNNKTITRNITGTLVQNEKIELEITTELLKLPKPNETIKNIACLIIDEEKQICDEEETKKDDTTPNLRITKTFIDGSTADKTYHTNDLVGYKITFGNNGSGTATGVILRDLLPQNLSFEFGSAQFWLSDGPSTISHTGYYSGGVQIDEYYDLTLPPHSSGYLILTGKVLDTHTNSTTNRACILHSTKNDCKQVIYTTDQPSLTIDKTVNNSTVNLNDEVIFTIMIKNNGNIPLSGFTVIDTLPAYINFVDLVGNHQFNSFQKSTDSKTLTRDTYQETLQPNASTTVQFRAKIIQTGTRTNRACVTHPNTAEQCDSTDVKAREKQYCRSPEVSSTILWADSNRNGETTVTCRTSNGEKANIRILCGNEGGTYSENNVSTLTRTCIYKMSSSSTNETRTPVCEVDGSSYDQYGYKCQTSVTMKKDNRPELGYCGNTIPELREDCDCRDGSKNCSLSRANIAGRANGNYNNAICKNCEIVNNNNERLVEPIACFNVNNGSISINKGEMLPFYWNIERINDDELYYEEVEIGRYQYKDALTNYRTLQGQSCSTLGAIALNAMVCNFKIYNGKELQSQGNYVYDIEGPCFTQGTDVQADWSSSPLISSFINWNQHNYIKDGNANGGNTFWSYNITNNKSYAFRSSVFIIDNFGNTDTNNKLVKYGERAKNSKQITTFGEYKLSLDSVKYLQCDNNKWKAQEPYPRVCEVNFSVTEPYILQKTPSGTINSTTESLKNYKMYANGTDVMTYSELNKILTVSPNSYANTTQISTAMENFIAKYSKLAVKINSSLFGSTSVKKVPGKHIYFVDGPLNIDGFRYEYDTSKTKVREVHGDNAIYTTPFTIIQTQGNTTIKGNLNHNMMLLTNGTITFDGIKNCNDAQTLKGIYYAKGGFISTSVAKNNKLSNPERCIGGNLHIKGIAIGNGLNNVMNNRRSELNQWFYSPAGTILSQTQRRNYLMNGAAVLIEYSPSIFTTATMPPGAEEFTKALEVYKR